MLYDALREKALVNFELLLTLWKLDFKKVTENEYDILATWRSDRNFGSCRFNTNKGRGADFAGGFLSDNDCTLLGPGFSKDDFSGFSEGGQASIGFDIIGLCQRVYNCNTYKDAAKYLDDDIRTIRTNKDFINVTKELVERRERERIEKEAKLRRFANDLWESSKHHKLEGSVGEKYLNSRGIYTLDKNIRFSPNVYYGPTKVNYPALIFKVQKSPDGPLVAIHRIFLDKDGKKAKVDNPKMVLASIKGAGIWFGEPSSTLHILEGPENALTMREMGADFVFCSVFSSNMPNVTIPPNVKKVIVAPDPDPSGENSYIQLREKLHSSMKFGLKLIKLELPIVKKKNGKYADLNDFHRGAA